MDPNSGYYARYGAGGSLPERVGSRYWDGMPSVVERAPDRSIFDWLGQGNSEATGQRLVSIQRPEAPIQPPIRPEVHIRPESPIRPKVHIPPPRHIPPIGPPYGQHTTSSPYRIWGAHSDNFRNPALIRIQDTPECKIMAYDVLHDPSEPAKDVTVRLSLPIEEDFQPNLEKFCRLRRLGRFKDAKEVFANKLKHLSTVPYVLVQYGEMLLASGDYKSFRSLRHWDKYPSIESDEADKDASLNKVEGNLWLLDFLAKVPQPTENLWLSDFLAKVSQPAPEDDMFQAITHTVGLLSSEPGMGSTETQMISLCLTILGYLEDSLGEAVTKRLKEEYVKQAFSWNHLYHRLLGEGRIWDLRDILVSAVPLFGSTFLAQFLGVTSFSNALDKIYEDWGQAENDESTNLGLLDLFTSLLLETPSGIGRDRNAALLLEYSKSLAESVQSINHEHMKTRPFIQWIIVKAISDMGAAPKRPDGLVLQDFSGLLLSQMRGLHLPIFIPAQPSDKPHWDMFSVRPDPQQRQVLQVALQAAIYIGDYRLQAISLKLLILNSQEPKALMDALANLQLNTQGDNEGFLETCLSKYLALASDDHVDRAALTCSFEKLDKILRDEYQYPGASQTADPKMEAPNYKPFYAPKPSFLWARDVVTRLLAAHDSESDRDVDFAQNNVEFWNLRLREYGARLPRAVAYFIRRRYYNVRIPTPIRPAPIPVYLPPRMAPIPSEFTHPSHQHAGYMPPGVSGQNFNPFVANPGHFNGAVNPTINPDMNPFNPTNLENRFDPNPFRTSGGFTNSRPPPPLIPNRAEFYSSRQSDPQAQYAESIENPDTRPSAKRPGAEARGIPEVDSGPRHWGIYPEHDKGPVNTGRRRTTIHIENLDHRHSSDDTETSDSNSYGSISDLSDSAYRRRYKPPVPAPSDDEPIEPLGQSSKEDYSDPESETSTTRIRNGPRRAKSHSSLKTVRPRPPPPLPTRPRRTSPGTRDHGPAPVNDKEVTDEELSTLSGRVKKANNYMNQKADEWMRDNRTKSRRPSIFQPRPVRPDVPGGLANVISTDDEETRVEDGVHPAGSTKSPERPSTAPEYLDSDHTEYHPSDSELEVTDVTDLPAEWESFGLEEKQPTQPGYQPPYAEQDHQEDQFDRQEDQLAKPPEQPVGWVDRIAEGGNIRSEDEEGEQGQDERRKETGQGTGKLKNKGKQPESVADADTDADADTRTPLYRMGSGTPLYRRGTFPLM